ncbi:MAG: riboflavin biosynthesis protein RibF [Oscillospiraceae bacterium]|jgi:aldose 1-epimerase|nr:riboflavin biosynthesis protein RibF [Oscillospiraceae bacterium]
MKRVLALGFFDGVHLGHGALLRRVRQLADKLGLPAAAISFDTHPDNLVSDAQIALINSPQDREYLMKRRYGMDEMLLLHFDRARMQQPWQDFVEETLLGEFHAAHVVCGEDFRFGARGEGTPEKLALLCAKAGVGCDCIGQVKLGGTPVSSTLIRTLLSQGELSKANRFLGHPHTLSGEVISGRHIGRTIGIPTANLKLEPQVLLPRSGVYAAQASFNGMQHPAVVNVGVCPTVGGEHFGVEAWILGYNGDLYGQTLRLSFYEYLRAEKTFPSLEALKAEIIRNAEQTQRIFAAQEKTQCSAAPFDSCDKGEVECITLRDETGVEVELLTLGATLRALRVPDRRGKLVDVCLGYARSQDYLEHDGCLGATIGRCANRIAGAAFVLDEQMWRLPANEGANTLHSGDCGYHLRIWMYLLQENGVRFFLTSPHLDQGFPGTLEVALSYTLRHGQLTLDYRAHCDRNTVVNLTNHAYFNLSGHQSGAIDAHRLQVNASKYTPCRAHGIPTGEIADVAGTMLDLRSPTRLGDRLPALPATRGYNHNFVLDAPQSAARVYSPDTGIALEIGTTLEGLQLYTAGFLSERRGKDGAGYGMHSGLCLEPQHFPDAVNQPSFPSPVLERGKQYHHRIVFSFYVEEEAI